MTLIHTATCNVCEATAPLLAVSGCCGVAYKLPHGWIDLGAGRHVCQRRECLVEFASRAAVPSGRRAGAS